MGFPQDSLHRLLNELVSLPKETSCVEFKQNWDKQEDIGEYISALSNVDALHKKAKAYIVWGVADITHEITGTSFKPENAREAMKSLKTGFCACYHQGLILLSILWI